MAFIMLLLIPACAVYAYVKGGPIQSFGVSVFTICIFLMFLVSTLYHAMDHDSPHKQVFRILDHIFISVSYTHLDVYKRQIQASILVHS